MQRVRQASPDVKLAASSRVGLAVLFSATLHVFLIFGISWQTPAGGLARISLLHARIVPPEPSAVFRKPAQPRPPAAALAARELVPPSRPLSEPLAPPHPGLPSGPETIRPRVFAAGEPLREPVQPQVQPPVPEPDIGAMPDLAFHPARDLDVYPIPLVRVAPPYPEDAKRARIAGAVTLLVLVDEFGRVSAVNVLDARPEGVFDAAAKDAYAAAVFSPASRHGHAVRSRLVIQVDFDPGGGE